LVVSDYIGVVFEIFIKIGVEISIEKEIIKSKKGEFIEKNT
jgi:hypothetical protein